MKQNQDEFLSKKREDLKQRKRKVHRTLYMAIFMELAVIVVIPVFYMTAEVPLKLLPILLIYIILPMAFLAVLRGRISEIEQDLTEVEYELDLRQYESSVIEVKAEKTLRLNDHQLQKYYNLNLSHNRWIFSVGIMCIVLSFLIILVTLFIVKSQESSLDSKLITSVLGAIGALLTSYTAAIYLKMHASAASHLGSFHSRLVDMQQILIASLVASRIEDICIREKTMAEIALKVSDRSKGT